MRVMIQLNEECDNKMIELDFVHFGNSEIYGNEPHLGLDQPSTIISLDKIRSIEFLRNLQ